MKIFESFFFFYLLNQSFSSPAPQYSGDVMTIKSPTREMVVHTDDVAMARSTYVDGGGGVQFRFEPEAAQNFGMLTSDAVGEILQIYLCDELVAEPILMEALWGGAGILMVDDVETALQYAEILSGEKSCASR